MSRELYENIYKQYKNSVLRINEEDMARYKCKPCGWVYDPKDHGNKPFSEWSGPCPKCGAPKSEFVKITNEGEGMSEEKEDMQKVHNSIMDFLKNNPSPPDEDMHALADKMGIDPHKFEGHVYMILGSILGAGRAKEKGFEEKEADSKELEMGIKVEMEHTTDPAISKRIALDHLAEIPDYYTRLLKMEKEAGIDVEAELE